MRSDDAPGRTELLARQAEYAAWLEATPEATRDNAAGGALRAIAELELVEIVAIQLSRGLGRDS